MIDKIELSKLDLLGRGRIVLGYFDEYLGYMDSQPSALYIFENQQDSISAAIRGAIRRANCRPKSIMTCAEWEFYIMNEASTALPWTYKAIPVLTQSGRMQSA